MVVSDRENHRLEYFDVDPSDPSKFEYSSTSIVDGLQRPCNTRFLDEHMVVAALEGPVLILDVDNSVLSSVDIAGLLGAQGHKHPHDAMLMPNGDLIVATWNPGRMSYWRRLQREDEALSCEVCLSPLPAARLGVTLCKSV